MRRPSSALILQSTRRRTPLRLGVLILVLFFVVGSGKNFASAFPSRPMAIIAPLLSASTSCCCGPTSTTFILRPSRLTCPIIINTNNNRLDTNNNGAAATTTKLHSLFGLGPAEVGTVLLAGLLVVGPSRLLRFARSAGSVTGKTITTTTSNGGVGNEWMEGIKSIPAEFNKGVEMGEIDARSRRARGMDNVDE